LVLGVMALAWASTTGASGKKVILGVGATVNFCNGSTQPLDIVFDNTANVDTASCVVSISFINQGARDTAAPPTGSGNIPAFGGVFTADTTINSSGGVVDTVIRITTTGTGPEYAANCAARRFTKPGTYRYHNSLFPADTFTLVIQKD
jgi:hypothetical protein